MSIFINRHPIPSVAARLMKVVAGLANRVSTLRQLVAPTLALLLSAIPVGSRADTVASLLGDFTINQYCGLQLENDSVKVHVGIVFGQLPALRELHQADANGDGVTSQEERDAYVSTLAPGIAERLALVVDGVAVPLRASGWTSSLPKEQFGFSMRLDIDYEGDLPKASREAARSLTFDSRNFPGRIGWHEITVTAPQGLGVFDTNAFSTSLTGGLTEALKSLPASGPLDERIIHLRFTRADVPAGSRMLASRDGTAAPVQPGASPGTKEAGWLSFQTRRLIGLISTPNVPFHVTVLALLAAMLLGAVHALSPGHGKSIVGAYLVGSRGTPRHAVFLGATVTVTHTLVVFALGLATLFASQFILPERVLPILSLASGLLVLGMGLALLAQRWRSARVTWIWSNSAAATESEPKALRMNTPVFAGHHLRGSIVEHAHARAHLQSHAHDHDETSVHMHSHDGHVHSHADDHLLSGHGAHTHTHDHGHHNDHGSGAHSHYHVAELTHSHGGFVHTHLPPGADGEAVSWRGLLALGISGGLLPCPSAMVLLLAAVALNKTLFGLLLVVAFSVGLATLIAVGLTFLYARNRFQSRLKSARWPHLLPVLSAASITMLGAFLCIGTLVSNPF